MKKETAWIYELIITPIIFVPLMMLDGILEVVKFLLGIKSKSLLNRWLDYEWKKTRN